MRLTDASFRRYRRLGYVLIGLLLSVLLFQQSIALSRDHRLAVARNHWNTRPFANYRLLIDENNGGCQQEVLVKGERVVASLQNSCRLNARTVNSLFNLIEGSPPAVYPCVEMGCACDTVLSTRTSYNPRFGYPVEIVFKWSPRANWKHPDYWKRMLITGRPPHCRAATFRRTITVLSLAPMH